MTRQVLDWKELLKHIHFAKIEKSEFSHLFVKVKGDLYCLARTLNC